MTESVKAECEATNTLLTNSCSRARRKMAWHRKSINEVFEILDKTNSGDISRRELKNGLAQFGFDEDEILQGERAKRASEL